MLEVAHELFYWNGIRATGVDRVAAEAGVAPTTLYRLFASKDDLVAAYVRRAHQLYRQWFDAAADAGGPTSGGRILGVFDALAEQIRPEQCRGCPFLMTLAEFPEVAHPAHREAVAMKTWVRYRFGELAAGHVAEPGGTAGEPADAAALADHLALLMEGGYASVQALGHLGPAARARSLVEVLLAAEHRPGPAER